MSLPEFTVKSDGDLTEEDFRRSPLWAGYYEPDDVPEIVRWGFSEDRVRTALDGVGWQDDHYFPLPIEAADVHWMRGPLFAIEAATANGTSLLGYAGRGKNLIVLFKDGARYVLSKHTPKEAERLSAVLNDPILFPLEISNRVTGENWRFRPEQV